MSQNDDDNIDKKVQFMMGEVDRIGAAASTVKDGHVLIFNRQYLKDLLEKNPGEKTGNFHQAPRLQELKLFPKKKTR